MTCLLGQFFPPENDFEWARLHCLQALCRCYLHLRTWGEASPALLQRDGMQHLVLYKFLHDHCGDSKLYNVYPKHHLFIHIIGSQSNPALCWNYADEDEIGQACVLAKACNVQFMHVAIMRRHRWHCSFKQAGCKCFQGK